MLAAPILALCQAADTPPAEEVPLVLRVNHAIALGVDYLERAQLAGGAFPGHVGQHPGGVTALAAFTLARSGVTRDDPALVRAWEALAGLELRSVYATSVHLLLCEALRDPGREEEARTSLEFLVRNGSRGAWAYPWGNVDNSNTQFALLGLRAASRMGLDVPEKVWLEALDGLSLFHDKGGGFVYSPGALPGRPNVRRPDGGMTAASLASLAVLQEAAAESSRLRVALERESELVEQGTAWMERHFDAAHNFCEDGSWKPGMHHAYLWAVERWCGLTGRTRIGAHDWYAEGARWLVDTQERDGSWDGERGPEHTCFALLFLRRATLTRDESLPGLEAELERAWEQAPERRQSPGPTAKRLTQWWLAGPWVQGGDESLLLEPPFDPAAARPRARAKLDRREWERVDLVRERWTDLDLLTERPGNGRIWVLSTWLAAPSGSAEAPLEATLWLELDDGWDVWLDGERLSRERRRSGSAPAEVSFPLRLARGDHLLTVVVEDRKGRAVFGALVTGADDGAPPAGLVARHDPAERKEERK